MYILEYCNDPEHADLKDGHRNFDDYFPLEFNNALNALDCFLYLTDMHRIIVSCASDFLHLQGGEEVEFWQINKYFLNTVSCRRGDVIGLVCLYCCSVVGNLWHIFLIHSLNFYQRLCRFCCFLVGFLIA